MAGGMERSGRKVGFVRGGIGRVRKVSRPILTVNNDWICL